jgi:hypothetical protein
MPSIRLALLMLMLDAFHAVRLPASANRARFEYRADRANHMRQAVVAQTPSLDPGLAEDLRAGLTRERLLSLCDRCSVEGGCGVEHDALRTCLQAPPDSQRVIVASFILPKLGAASPPRLAPVAFAEALVQLAVQAACEVEPNSIDYCLAELQQLAALARDLVGRSAAYDDLQEEALTQALTPALTSTYAKSKLSPSARVGKTVLHEQGI